MQRTFFVSVSDPIVQLDLSGALTDNFPQAQVIPVKDMDEVASHVNDNRFIICLIVSASLWSEDTREVLDTVVEKGGHIVSIGQPKVTGIPATVLNVPFNTQMLLKALSSDAAAPHVPQPEDRT